MLEKHRRLRKKEFNDIYDRGQNYSAELGYFKTASIEGVSRFSCVAAKKEVKKSVHRTRIRRRGYGALQKYIDQIPDGYGVIWFLPQEAAQSDFDDLEKAVKSLKKHLK